MHRRFRELLPDAIGDSFFVVAIFLDVRGFSKFAGMAESVEAAVFLKKMYLSILNDYLSEPDFFKPTGDGLMVLYHYEEDTLSDVAKNAVEKSCELLDAFPNLLADDPMVHFDVPQHLGIGIARGATTRLRSNETSLDYSGRPLNLAARLMDLARPEGVVLDGKLRGGVLPDDLLDRFSSDSVYIRGVAEDVPHDVLFLTDRTVIPAAAHQPIGQYTWQQENEGTITFGRFRERETFIHELSRKPAFPDDVKLEIQYPKPTASGRPSQSMHLTRRVPAQFVDHPDGPRVRVDYAPVAASLEETGVNDAWKVRLRLQYKVSALDV